MSRLSACRAVKSDIEHSLGAQFEDWNKRIASAAKPANQEPHSIEAARDRADQLRRERDAWIKTVLTAMDQARYDVAIAELATIERELLDLPKPSVVYCGSIHTGTGSFSGTGGKPRPIHVLPRGDVTKPGREVQAGAVAVLTHRPARFTLTNASTEGDRRAALAEWIADRDNPLTWRSIVNRVWRYHFGRGLGRYAERFRPDGPIADSPRVARLARRRVSR